MSKRIVKNKTAPVKRFKIGSNGSPVDDLNFEQNRQTRILIKPVLLGEETKRTVCRSFSIRLIEEEKIDRHIKRWTIIKFSNDPLKPCAKSLFPKAFLLVERSRKFEKQKMQPKRTGLSLSPVFIYKKKSHFEREQR